MAWRGNPNNPVPNEIQEPIDRSEKIINDNRAEEVRRDKDTQKNFSISLYDIDETILIHLDQMQLQVEDIGKKIKVPIFYGSPERWTSVQRDGYIRDNQGKLILPAIVLKRTNSENDQTLQFFNRYLNTPAIKLYSSKNKYTKFSILNGQNVPVNEVYNVIIPSHMLLTYHFIIWTEKVEQMNDLVQAIQFNTRDYWGSRKGFRFRTKVESYSHTVELQADEDRVVKTEFDLTTHGYILPDQITKLDKHQMTTTKMFTPKKIVMGAEVVNTEFDLKSIDKNRQKWQNPNYPNLQADVPIPNPPISVVDGIIDSSNTSQQIIDTLHSLTATSMNSGGGGGGVENWYPYLRIVSPPNNINSPGSEGLTSYDKQYFYIYSAGKWRRVAISEFE
jgi:hypothetical protein